MNRSKRKTKFPLPTQSESDILKETLNMRLLRSDGAPSLTLMSSGLTVMGEKGYRSIRGSHGIQEGHLYFEVRFNKVDNTCHLTSSSEAQMQLQRTLAHNSGQTWDSKPYNDSVALTTFPMLLKPSAEHSLHQSSLYPPVSARVSVTPGLLTGESGHLRLGVATIREDLNAPVGFKEHSFGYGDVKGNKTHQSLSEVYGEPFVPGDVIGCHLYLPASSDNSKKQRLDPLVASLSSVLKREFSVIHGSSLTFYKNGVSQGTAFTDLPGGPYFPMLSLYLYASASVNFGPDFAYPPPDLFYNAEVEVPIYAPDTHTPASVFSTTDELDSAYLPTVVVKTPVVTRFVKPPPPKKKRFARKKQSGPLNSVEEEEEGVSVKDEKNDDEVKTEAVEGVEGVKNSVEGVKSEDDSNSLGSLNSNDTLKNNSSGDKNDKNSDKDLFSLSTGSLLVSSQNVPYLEMQNKLFDIKSGNNSSEKKLVERWRFMWDVTWVLNEKVAKEEPIVFQSRQKTAVEETTEHMEDFD